MSGLDIAGSVGGAPNCAPRCAHLVGWSKAPEQVKVARKDREQFDCATWLHKAKEMPKEGLKVEGVRHLTGKETEPWEIIYFEVSKVSSCN
jgi:hypothetical protein